VKEPAVGGFAAAWPHLRAFLIAAHVVAIVLMALPAPGGGMNRASWADPTPQAEFKIWNSRLGAVGYELSDKEFEDRLWDLAVEFMKVRDGVLDPFDPYYRWCGTYQSWRMFVAPAIFPDRLWIEVHENGEWKPVFVERSWTYTWLWVQLGQDRMRSATFRYAWKPYKKTYVQFADWIAAQAARDFPNADKVRTKYEQGASPTPQQARAGIEPETSFVSVQTRDLAQYRTP
jgi:hypothetical protein